MNVITDYVYIYIYIFIGSGYASKLNATKLHQFIIDLTEYFITKTPSWDGRDLYNTYHDIL